jgi:hypothetical protein
MALAGALANTSASSGEGRSSEEPDPSDFFDQIYAAKRRDARTIILAADLSHST